MLAGFSIDAEVGHAEFAAAELVAELVPRLDVSAGGVIEDGELGDAGGRVLVLDGERVLLLVLPLLRRAL